MSGAAVQCGDTVNISTLSGYVLRDKYVVEYMGVKADGSRFVFVDDSGSLIAVPLSRVEVA